MLVGQWFCVLKTIADDSFIVKICDKFNEKATIILTFYLKKSKKD